MNNARSAANLSLDLFGGLCSEVAPSDLPEGASPLCYDCDFQVGQVRTRDPISPVYSFSGNAAGPNTGTVASQSGAGVVWGNPNNILVVSGSYATAAITGASSTQGTAGAGASGLGGTAWTNPNNVSSPTSYATSVVTSSAFAGANTATLAATNCGLTLPLQVSPTGIQVDFDSLVTGPTSNFVYYTVFLLINGNIIGSSRDTSSRSVAGSTQTITLGGPTDIWDTLLATSDMVSPTFGVRIQGTLSDHSKTVTFEVRNVKLTVFYPPLTTSEALNVTGFGFAIPGNVTGIQVSVTGHYAGILPNLTVQVLTGGVVFGTLKSGTLSTTDTTLALGGPIDLWNVPWTMANINNPNFGLSIVASADGVSTISLDVASITVFTSPTNAPFTYLKSFVKDDGEIETLALDAAGALWKEDALTNPGVLSSLTANILPGNSAKSVTLSDEEWIAINDLLKGTDSPIHGSNLDRISQVGPGAGPALVGQAANINVWSIVASPNGLTQAAATSDPADPGHFQAVNWSAGPFSRSPGNVLTIFYQQTTFPVADSHLIVGGAVRLNMTSAPFTGLTGTYIVTSVGQGVPPGGSGARWYFTVQVAATGNTFVGGPDSATGTYQVTLATLKTTTPAEIVVNNAVTIAGAGVTAWNATWTILATLNGAQILITSTSLTGNVATYNYTLISGVAPTAGQQVTITGCTNGPIVNGTSIFNVSKVAIETAGAGTFTISLNAANVSSAPESANGIIDGTIFQFDPGLSNLGAGINGIFGNSGGGTVTTSGNLGAGVRQAVTLFYTRNGLVTAPSPPTIFETTGSTNVIQASNIAIGPPDVLARIVAFTGADGGNFFYIPDPVTIQGAGQPTTYTATKINDNVTTSATFIFTDQVLLAATAIDIQGNNTFNQIELGPSAFAVAYANRMFYGLELNKIQNFINTTFDGGYLPNQNGISLPLGWTAANAVPDGVGGQVVPSPIFGNAYYIQNTTGGVAAVSGQISQSAYQDFYKVPIILPSFTYSVRVKARTPSSSIVGNLVIDLFSPTQARVYGSYTQALSTMSSAMEAFAGTLLTTAFATQVPQDLVLRVYATNLQNLGDVEIDRFEVYPTLQPVLTTELQGSYAGNLEAFDGNTGVLGVGSQTNQSVVGAFVNYDQLYILKSNSIFSTKDSANSEPSSWAIREVSNKVGCCGINAYDYGEEWAVFAHRSGLYMFDGSAPQPISLEIGPTWDAINWSHQETIWVRNDSTNRKILVGVPMATPNIWLPTAAANANPTTPNVILMMNYKDLTSAQAISERAPVHVSAFAGKLMAWDMSRKWSIWQIPSNYADFVSRNDNEAPLFFCQNNATISAQDPTAESDNGVAVDSLYTTYGFVQSETEQQYGPLLGDHRKTARYLELNAGGSGKMSFRVLPNSLTSKIWWDVPGGFALVLDPTDNLEAPLNISGNRLYCQIRTNTIGANFSLSQIKLTVSADRWAAVRGVSA